MKNRCKSILRLLVPLCLFLVSPELVAADNARFELVSIHQNEQLEIQVANVGKGVSQGLYLGALVAGQSYGECQEAVLHPGELATFVLWSQNLQGVAEIHFEYLNEGERLGLVHVQQLRPEVPSQLSIGCTISDLRFQHKARIWENPARLPAGTQVRLALPSHVSQLKEVDDDGRFHFVLENKQNLSKAESDFFIIYERNLEAATGVVLQRQICKRRIVTLAQVRWSRLAPPGLLLAAGLTSFFSAFVCYCRGKRSSAWEIAVVRAQFSFSLASVFFLIFRSSGPLLDLFADFRVEYFSSWRLSGGWSRAFFAFLDQLYFSGNDYRFFFEYVAVPLYCYFLFANVFVIRFLIRPIPAEDKYWQLMVAVFSSKLLAPLRDCWMRKGSCETLEYSSQQARIALRAYAVKLFFLPLLCSWSIQNILRLLQMETFVKTSYAAQIGMFIEVLILVDVLVFTFGYIVELPQLRSVIRSVEPTFLGWFVCLICYPPLNGVFFPIFNFPLVEDWPVVSGFSKNFILTIILLLWLVYCWATLALGAKASNLTNRGIIVHGPYRYVRHPAYASKVSVWLLSALFLGEGFALNVLASILVYGLRAMTEEAHLGRDTQYLEYQKKVRKRFIPGVY